MEPLPGDVAKQSSSRAAASPGARIPYRPAAADTPVAFPVELARLALQRRAPENLRRHVGRAAARFLVLLVSDLAALWLAREAIRAVRDRELLGHAVAAPLQAIVPRGFLDGWQLAAAFGLALLVLGNYGPGDRRRDPGRIFAASALAVGLALWHAIWERGPEVVFVQYSLATVLLAVALTAERLVLDAVIARVLPRSRSAVRTVFVGPCEECREVAGRAVFARSGEYLNVGFVDIAASHGEGALGTLADLSTVIDREKVEAVVVCGYLTDKSFRDVVDTALSAGCQLLAMPRATGMAGVQPQAVWKNGQPLIELTAPGLKGQQLVLKRALDLVGSGVGLVVLSPLFALVALLIKLDSPGPIFFRQDRVGRGGRVFRIIKFRTMADGAEQQREGLLAQSIYRDARLFKVPNDPRITSIGRWLRRSSLDELPQLINVLKEEMSLVGPRPPLPSEVALYEAHHYARFDVKPGMTGPWQVAGRNEITDFEQVIARETDYIRNWSLIRDFAILLRTIPLVLRMRGAA